ncbi:MAG: hypothetical protein SFY66_19640 [Oculatellaceae cyanobacterium bins.114]|nr:hypothetical protein [Oculatellaceae cyanobacterium bins.114]
MKKQLQIPQIDPVYAVGGLIALVFIVMNGGDSLRKMSQSRAASSEIIEANQEIERQAMLDTASAERQNAIAVKRYEEGCQMVFSRNRASFVALQEGQAILDPVTNQPLPNGGVYCDHLGNTGILKGGRLTSMAFASDRLVVEQAKLRYTTLDSIPQHNNPAQ